MKKINILLQLIFMICKLINLEIVEKYFFLNSNYQKKTDFTLFFYQLFIFDNSFINIEDIYLLIFFTN